MSNVQSYNALIDRFKAFASGHFILKTFSHGQIDTADLEKFTEYPFMHVVPSNVTYAKGTKTFSFQIVLADLPRDKDDKVEFQREVLSDLQRIAEDLVAEITNHRVLFGDLITVQNVSLEPFLEEFHNTLTGWTVSLELLVPYYWDACSIPAEWNDMFESGSGGTGSILTFIDSITRDEYGNVSLVNDEATPAPNYYYGTNDEGVRGWYLLTDEVGLTCATIGTCQTIIDIEAAIDLLQEDVTAIEAELPNKVPYTGATGNVDLGEYELKAGQLTLDTSPTGTAAVGTTRWNNTIGSSETTLKGGSVILKNGVDLVARVVNKVTPNTTLTKAAYQAVRISGAQGQRLAVAFAQANNDNNSADTIGIVCETIATNQEGFIQTVGQLESINTTGSLQGETWADGDVLYLSPTTAGALTNIKPTGATGHIVVIGYVEYAHANNGKIYVKIMNGWELDELHNVYITSPANNEVLTYESSTSLWKNKTVETALGFTPVPTTRTLTINGTTQDLSADRTFTIATGLNVGTTPITSGAVGRVLFEGTGNVLQEDAAFNWNSTFGRLELTTTNLTSSCLLIKNSTTSNELTLRAANTDSLIGFNNRLFFLTSTTLTISQAGNVGIGISNPTTKFQVATGTVALNTTSGNTLIGTTTDAGYKLDVNGTARVQGNAQFGTGFYWDNTNSRLGIGTASPTNQLHLNGPVADSFDAIPLLFVRNTLFTNTSVSSMIGLAKTTGDMVDGFGPRILFSIQDNSFGDRTNQIAAFAGVRSGSDNSGSLIFQTASSGNNTTKMQIFPTGNVGINTTTDAGFKLNVNGTARVVGNFNPNANINLHSGGTAVKNIDAYWGGDPVYGLQIHGNASSITTSNGIPNGYILRIGSGFSVAVSANADYDNVRIGTGNFIPTSGMSRYNLLNITGVINQTGTATGITRGLYINPTLTAAADFRAIETARGNVVFGNLPTSSAGLPTGAIWNDAGTLKIV